MQRPWDAIKVTDPEVHEAIERELDRQNYGLEMIASENFAPSDVIAVMANPMQNKYAEGRPGKRYYGGCQEVDKTETLAIDRACSLFGAKFANVQPHSGAQANAAAYLALLNAGDSILGLDLSHGGHLTHGSSVNFSGILYKSHFYQVDASTETINYERLREDALAIKPKMIIAGASAYPRTIDFAKFRKIADDVGAYLLVDMAHIAGLVATGLHPNPVPHAHVVTTTTHKTLRGPRGGLILWNDDALTVKLNKGVFPGTQGGPLEHIIAAKAVCFRKALDPSFKTYQKKVVENARVLASELLANSFKLVSGGTDNHLILINLSDTDVTGKDFEEALEQVAITVNKNTVPNEKRSPFVTSGIRVGTPALTTRGLGTTEMKKIAKIFHDTFHHLKDDASLGAIRKQVIDLATQFPLYPEWA
ncbi:MAG: serine hydroxymethyltransferase [Deltaproteobacteria bacterium]|nr:serine hydroxymethyltransferase [Deltaproteobacteria bacterium]